MAVFQGAITTFAGVTGLLQTILGHILGTQYSETLGTGNDVLKTFSTMLTSGPISKGQCRIQLKISNEIYDIWDNGEGEFEHEIIDTSSINYTSKAVNITTFDPVDNLWNIPVDYVTGDEGEDWFLHLNQTTRDNNGDEAYTGDNPKEVVIKNSGVNWKENIIIGLREWKYPGETLYCLNHNLYSQFNYAEQQLNDWNVNRFSTGKTAYDATRHSWTTHPNTPINDDNMYYWLFSNKRRIVIIIRVAASIYVSLYIGGGQRLAPPSQYPKPYCVIASFYGNNAYTSTNTGFRYIINPYPGGNSSLMCFDNDNNYKNNNHVAALPKAEFENVGELKKANNNKALLYPVYLYDYDANPTKTYMVLDGVYFSPGVNLASEDIVEIGGDDYLVIQDIFRTTYQDYMVVKME